MQKIGQVAYKLDLSIGSHIHPVFHVSALKTHIGAGVSAQPSLPNVCEDDASLLPTPPVILDRCTRKGRSKVLVHWHGLSLAKATWEDLVQMRQQFTKAALEDKGNITRGELLCA